MSAEIPGVPAQHGHRKVELRSLRYHRRIAERLAQEPELLQRALRRVEGWLNSPEGAPHPMYARGWHELLTGPVQALLCVLTDDTERARDYRQVTPFAGALSAQERWELFRQSLREDT